MKLVNNLVRLVFPQRCLLCGEKSNFPICDGCLSNLNTNFNRCKICSRPVLHKNSVCLNCLKFDNQFHKGFSLFNYREVDKIIELIKFYGYPGVVNFLFRFEDQIKNSDVFYNADCLVAVPMHKKDIKVRGFNQAALIAKVVSKITKIRVCYDCVEKIKQTKQQVGLSAKQRRKNLKGAFLVVKKPNCKNIVIIDDVFTTGSTINEISELFSRFEIKCNFFTVASTPQN